MTDRGHPRDSGLPETPARRRGGNGSSSSSNEEEEVEAVEDVEVVEDVQAAENPGDPILEENMADQVARDAAQQALQAAQQAQQAANAVAGQQLRVVAVSGGQLSAINEFSGDPKKDIDVWLEQIDNFATQFQWTDANTAAAAKAKLTDKAAFWLASQRKMNKTYPRWKTGDGAVAEAEKLRVALRKRFKPTVTAVEATQAIIGLKQKENETVQEFYDRVVWAVDRKNYKILDKTTDAYQESRDSDIFAFFGAGLKEKIATIAMSGGDAPDTHEALLERAVTIEISHEKGRGVFAIEGSEGTAEGAAGGQPEPAKDELKELTKQVAALTKMMGKRGRGGRGRGGNNGKCHRCQQTGHFVRNCPQPATNNPTRGGANRGGRGGQGNQSRGGGNQRGGYTPPAYFGQQNYDPQRSNFGQGGYYGQQNQTRQTNAVYQQEEEIAQEAENY